VAYDVTLMIFTSHLWNRNIICQSQ